MDIETRLGRLERSVARWRAACVAALLVAAAALVVLTAGRGEAQQAGGGVADTVRAKRIEVVNAAGKATVILSGQEGDGSILVRRKTGETAVSIFGEDGGGLVSVHYPTGESAAQMQVSEKGKAEVFTWTRDNKITGQIPSR